MASTPDLDLNLDALLETIYTVQVDLRILAEQCARDRQPAVHQAVLQTLAAMHFLMAKQQPSLRRH